jgi:hypothetical protein
VATIALSASPATLDSGASDYVTVTNTGGVDVTVARGSQSFTLRPNQSRTVYPEGSAVTASVASGSGQVTTTVQAAQVTQAQQVAANTAAIAGLPGTYAGIRNQRSMPRLKSLPVLMATPPTITFTGASNPASLITSAQFLSAVDVPFPGTPTALSSNFTYRGGIVQRDNTYYGLPKQPTLSASLPYSVAGWFYGQKIEFAYRGTGALASRLSVNGDYAEAVYTADSTQNGAPHVRAFDFGSADWRFLEFECAAGFFGIYMGPTDTWTPAPVPTERLLVIGDSYGGGTGATAWFTAYHRTLGRLLGFEDVWTYSFGGTGLLAVNGSNPKYRDRSADWSATNATAVLIQNSINDDGSTTTALNAEMVLLVAAVRSALPNAKVWMLGPPAKGGSDVASKQPRDTALAAQAASLSVPYVSLVNPRALWSSAPPRAAGTATSAAPRTRRRPGTTFARAAAAGSTPRRLDREVPVAGFGIALEVDNHDRKGRPTAVQRLGKVERQARDFTPALRQIRKSFYAAERQQFASEGGGEWRPDTPRTLARKAKRGQDARTMRASGALYRALALGQGPGAVDQMSTDELTLGTSLVQGRVAQRSPNPKRRRRVLVMTKRRRAKWLGIIRDHVTGDGKP